MCLGTWEATSIVVVVCDLISDYCGEFCIDDCSIDLMQVSNVRDEALPKSWNRNLVVKQPDSFSIDVLRAWKQHLLLLLLLYVI